MLREGTPASTKRCRSCTKWLPVGMFHKDKVLADGTQAYRSECKLCKAEKQREYYEKNREKCNAAAKRYREENRERILRQKKERYELLKSDPVAWAEHIRYKTEWNRRSRREDPERWAEYTRRYWQRLQRDPERLARARQNRRMAYEASRRIRAEHGGYEEHAFELVDAAPFKAWMLAEREAGRSLEQLALGSGVSPRSLRRVLAGQEKVKLDMVDRVTMANDVMLWEMGYDD